MPPAVSIGRFLFALLFIVSGVYKFSELTAAAEQIRSNVYVPSIIASLVPEQASGYVTQVETLTGMKWPMLLAISAGALELIGGAMVALNMATRFFAVLLIGFVTLTILYFHNFWAMPDGARAVEMFNALKGLSLIGGLLVIAGYPRASLADNDYAGSDSRY